MRAIFIIFALISIIASGDVPVIGSFGIIICSGNGDLFLELMSLLFSLKHSNYALPSITIAHCDEISSKNQQILESFSSSRLSIKIMDICANRGLSMRSRGGTDGIKGFFCKPMALLHSPYQHTLIMDTDVIWLGDPLQGFKSKTYELTGTLFVRDRWTQTKNRLTLTKGLHTASHLYQYIKDVAAKFQDSHGNEVGAPTSASIGNISTLAEKNAFWRHFAYNEGTTLDHMQVRRTSYNYDLFDL